MPIKTVPLITVAIPTYGREEILVQTIKDLLAQDVKNIEIVVVDQTKTHNKETQSFFDNNKDARLRHFKTNPPSSPAARNFCMAKARADIILFLDDDIRVEPDFVSEHLRVYKEKSDVSVVAGRVKQKGVPFTHTLVHFSKYAEQIGWFNCPDPQYTKDFPGGNFSAKKSVLIDVGDFETSYMVNAFREESDYAMRVARAGYKMYFNPKAAILHLAAPSGGNRLKTHQFNNFEFYKNDLLFTLKFVAKHRIPVALGKKYGRYVYTTYVQNRKYQTLPLFFLRNLYFATGLIVATKRYFYPIKIVQTEVKN